MATKNNTETHEKAVEYAACNLIETGITTRSGPGKGIDLVLDNGKTILVRGMREEINLAVVHGPLDMLKADYVIVATNLKYRCSRHIYILTTDDIKEVAQNAPNKSDGGDNWFVNMTDYQKYRDNHNVLRN